MFLLIFWSIWNFVERCSPTQKLKIWFSTISSQEIGSSWVSLEIIFESLQCEPSRFKFNSIRLNLLNPGIQPMYTTEGSNIFWNDGEFLQKYWWVSYLRQLAFRQSSMEHLEHWGNKQFNRLSKYTKQQGSSIQT